MLECYSGVTLAKHHLASEVFLLAASLSHWERARQLTSTTVYSSLKSNSVDISYKDGSVAISEIPGTNFKGPGLVTCTKLRVAWPLLRHIEDDRPCVLASIK